MVRLPTFYLLPFTFYFKLSAFCFVLFGTGFDVKMNIFTGADVKHLY